MRWAGYEALTGELKVGDSSVTYNLRYYDNNKMAKYGVKM
jgi:hypothetical protein